MTRRVGILAIQGDVEAHARAIERLGATPCPVLREKDLSEVDALVLPGGEPHGVHAEGEGKGGTQRSS